jgi:hypothetical protein
MIHKSRVLLIRLGKVLPFVVCSVVMLSYAETIFSLTMDDLTNWNGSVIPTYSVSWFIGSYFEYNLQMLVVLCIISIAIETCIFNKLACAYLGINLWEKSYLNFELEPTTIYLICLANIIVAGYLTYEGLRIILRKQKLYYEKEFRNLCFYVMGQ